MYEAQRTNPQQPWKSIDTLLCRGRPSDQVEITAEEFQRLFEDKVAAVRSSTASAPKPDFVTGPPGVSRSVFDPVHCNEVANTIRQLPDKTCAADPVPTSVLKQLADHADDISSFLATLINRSLTEEVFPVTLQIESLAVSPEFFFTMALDSLRLASRLAVVPWRRR